MKENTQFKIAMRRNQQLRSTDGFLKQLAAAMPLPPKLRILSADESVRMESQVLKLIQSRSGPNFNRRSDLTWSTVKSIFSDISDEFNQLSIMVFLSHFVDFAFETEINWFIDNTQDLVAFDGDTIFATDLDLSVGIALDRYEKPDTNEWYYELDTWGFCVR